MLLTRLLRVVALVVCSAFAVALVWAQTPAAKVLGKTVISEENTLLSWGVVVALLGVVALLVTNVTQFKAHRDDKDIHQTTGNLRKAFRAQEDCIRLHNGLVSTLSHIDSTVQEVRERLSRIEGQLEAK